MNGIDGLTHAKYGEWIASLFGACIIAFVLGLWLHDLFEPFAWPILVAGVALHAYGMYKTYKRNQ